MNYISICTPFYPWYRDWDRSNELFDYLIPSLNKAGSQKFELVVLDCGIDDVWKLNRHKNRDFLSFQNKLKADFNGKLTYILTNECIAPKNHVVVRERGQFWMANAVNLSIENSTSDYVFIMNMDIEIPINFYEEYFKNVDYGKVWFPKCFHIRRDFERNYKRGGLRSGRGLVGITKKDYWDIGGTDHINFIKNRHDSDLYLRCRKKYEIKEGKLEGLFHIDHPGTNEGSSQFKFNKNPWNY